MSAEFRPAAGRILAAVVIALCALGLVLSVVQGGSTVLWRFGPWVALICLAVWAGYWNPRVVMTDSGVRVVNVTRTVDVPWAAITDVRTRWALTLETAAGSVSAWAAPAPGAAALARSRRQGEDEPSTAAAAAVKAQWLERHSGTPQAAAVTKSWNAPILIAAGALVVAGLAADLLLA